MGVLTRVVDHKWNRVERVARFRGLDPVGFGVHDVGVAVVGRVHEYAADFVNHLDQSLHTLVEHSHGFDGGFEVSGVADHVAVGKVESPEPVFAAAEQFDGLFGDLAKFHAGRRVEFDVVARNLDVGLEIRVDVARSVAVPEVGDVTKLLSLADSEASYTFGAKKLAHRAIDRWRSDEVLARNVSISVVLEHARVVHGWIGAAIEELELFVLVGHGDLDCPIAPKI